MHNVQHHKEIATNSVMNVIFDACRANPNRAPRDVAGFKVTFTLLANGDHEAAMHDTTGRLSALPRWTNSTAEPRPMGLPGLSAGALAGTTTPTS